MFSDQGRIPGQNSQKGSTGGAAARDTIQSSALDSRPRWQRTRDKNSLASFCVKGPEDPSFAVGDRLFRVTCKHVLGVVHAPGQLQKA